MSSEFNNIRAVLQTAAQEWTWNLVSSPQPGISRLTVVASHKQPPRRVRRFTIDQAMLDYASPADLARFLQLFLGSKSQDLVLECRLEVSASATNGQLLRQI